MKAKMSDFPVAESLQTKEHFALQKRHVPWSKSLYSLDFQFSRTGFSQGYFPEGAVAQGGC